MTIAKVFLRGDKPLSGGGISHSKGTEKLEKLLADLQAERIQRTQQRAEKFKQTKKLLEKVGIKPLSMANPIKNEVVINTAIPRAVEKQAVANLQKAIPKTDVIAHITNPTEFVKSAVRPIVCGKHGEFVDNSKVVEVDTANGQRKYYKESDVSKTTMLPKAKAEPLQICGEQKDVEVEVKSVAPTGNLLASKKISTFICRVGTKSDIAKWIVKHMTNEALQTYVEPFIGGGAIYLEKSPAQKEAINDFNYAIYNSWKDLKDTSPSDMLEQWKKDKITRAYAKTVLGHNKEYNINDLNVKAYILLSMKAKSSAERKAFGDLDPKVWESKLIGNRLRYIPQEQKPPKSSNVKTLTYTDLKDGSKKTYSVEDATFLYSLYRAGKNLLDNTRNSKLDINDYVGSAKPSKDKGEDIMKSLMAEDLPKVSLKEWLKDRFKVMKNPDMYAIDEEKDVLVADNKLAQLIYEKLRSCGGFGGSGVVASDVFIRYIKGNTRSPLAKVPMGDSLKFLLYPNGGLSEYNERLKNTDVMNGDYYKLVEKYDSPNTFFMLDPPYQATGGYGNPNAFNFEAFVKALNGIPDERLNAKNPTLKGKILVTINGGDKVLALFRKYARASGIKWYGLKVYVRQKAGKGGYRYEIFYGNYKFDDRAVDVLDNTFRNNFSGVNVKEEDESQFKEATDDGAIYIENDGSDKTWSAFKSAKGAVGHFDARNAEDRAVGIAEKEYAGKPIEDNKKKNKKLKGGYYRPNTNEQYGSMAYRPSVSGGRRNEHRDRYPLPEQQQEVRELSLEDIVNLLDQIANGENVGTNDEKFAFCNAVHTVFQEEVDNVLVEALGEGETLAERINQIHAGPVSHYAEFLYNVLIDFMDQ